MKENDTTQRQRHETNRQNFCIQGSCAAAGMLSFSALCLFPESFGAPIKEGIMTGEITGITVKVASVKGTCGLGHKAGDTARITQNGVDGKICIHALYSMLPAAFAMLYDAKFPWLQNPEVKTHACPDAANPVVFELIRTRNA